MWLKKKSYYVYPFYIYVNKQAWLYYILFNLV